MASDRASARVLEPAVAGLFYPARADDLRGLVGKFLAAADGTATAERPWALLVPHAGYTYSGAVAAAAYARLRPFSHDIARVVLMGPSHHLGFTGLAVPVATTLRTPLGPVAVDAHLRRMALALPSVRSWDAPHAGEHCLEVQLPFLSTVLQAFTLLPVVIGSASDADVLALLDALPLLESDCLLVVSSDLSHFHAASEADRLDARTLDAVLSLDPRPLDAHAACGYRGLRALLRWARGRHLAPRLLAACNSAKTSGDYDRVVGYAALEFR